MRPKILYLHYINTIIPYPMNSPKTVLKNIITGLFSLLIFFNSQAQVKPYTFPKIKPEDFSARIYEKDTTAVAVILGDKGESYLEYNESKGFQLIFIRHLRIRILTKEGYNFATRSLKLYRNTGSAESVSDIKGFTYNLVNGKVTEDKLGSGNIFEEQINQNWVRTIFTMPNVKAGSIIDLRYKIISDFIWNVMNMHFTVL